MASFNQKDPIHWCKATTDGRNPMKLKRKAISPAGTVCEISLANGKAQTRMLGNVYAQIVQAEKLAQDWIWYETCDDCPPVEAGADIEALGLCSKCMAREVLIGTRQQAHSGKSADYAAMFESRMDRLARVMEANMVADQRPKLSTEQLEVALADEKKKEKVVRKVK